MFLIHHDRFPQPEPGPENQFEGRVELRKAIERDQTDGVAVYLVSFHEGARTFWHTHSRHQALHVVEGRGRVQKWGEAVQEIVPGDVVFIQGGEKHWHGAGTDSRMTHLAVSAGVTDWLERVDTDQE